MIVQKEANAEEYTTKDTTDIAMQNTWCRICLNRAHRDAVRMNF